MDKSKLVSHLAAKLGRDNVYSEREDLLVLGYDSTPELHALPDIAVFPRNEEDLAEVINLANDEGLAIVPRGSGTGLSG